jgi:hypothetical protein
MLNLAPWHYRHALAVDGGPIERIESGVITVLGESRYQANAYLKTGLRREGNEKVLYSNADGTGTDVYSELARHKAISESLERWAHAMHAPQRKAYGFDIDPSSNGMAAFPGFGARRARQRAFAEAVERHTVMSWWTGALDAEARSSAWEGVNIYELECPVPEIKVAVLHTRAGQQSHAYGQGAGKSLDEAISRASVEMVRAQTVIARYERRHQHEPALNGSVDLFERRCIFFARVEGYALFQERLGRRKDRSCRTRVIFDGEIEGPWTKYAHVWRVVFEPITPEFLEPRDDFFFW